MKFEEWKRKNQDQLMIYFRDSYLTGFIAGRKHEYKMQKKQVKT